MVGHVLTRQLREILGEGSTSSWINVQLSYDLIYEAVLEFVDRTACLQTSSNITTAANNSTYTLPYDFLRLYMKDDNGDFFIRYVDANNSTNDFIYDDYEDIIQANNSNSTTVPSSFSIIPGSDRTQITGNTTTAGAVDTSTCLSNLIYSTGTFVSTVSVGDDVFDMTNSYSGKVISVTNNTTLSTAMYGSTGSSVGWANATSFLVQPQPRLSLIIDPPTLTANETITVYYVQKPNPVYSPYKAYNIHPQYMSPIVKYAAFVYKYRDMEPNFGDKWYVAFDTTCKQAKQKYDSSVRKKGWHVNLMRPQYGK